MESSNNNNRVFTYPIIAQPTNNKKYFVARFPGTNSVDFSKLAPPIKMQREKEVDVEEIPALPTINTNNPRAVRRRQIERFFEKKKAGRKSREGSWNLTDEAKHSWEGVPEDQLSTYVLLRMEGKDFKVYPVGKWYNFKEKKSYQTLTLEQAEAQLLNRGKGVGGNPDRWLMQKLNQDDVKNENIKEESSISDASASIVRRGRIKDEEGADDNLENELDFDEKFEDDEDYENPQDDNPEERPKPLNKEEEENDQSLSASGKELKTLLRNIEKEDEFGTSDEEEEEEEEKTDIEKPALEPLVPVKTETSTDEVSNNNNLKRPLDANDSLIKRAKTEPISSLQQEEEEVRKALLLSGKIKTNQLIKKFKTKFTADPAKKERFAQIVKKLGRIIEEHGEKYIVLKDEYRAGLKPTR